MVWAERAVRRRAGTSAAGEYARLKREWLRRNRRIFGWLGVACGVVVVFSLLVAGPDGMRGWICDLAAGVVLAFFVLARESPPAWIEQYQTGAAGEERTAKALAPLLRSGWVMVHDVGRRRFNIDHLLIGPGGVFVLETKNVSGTVAVEGDRATLTRPGSDRPDYQGEWWARQARSHAVEVNKFFRQRVGVRPWVNAAVVLWADFPQQRVDGHNVSFVAGDHLATWLTSQPSRLTTAQIGRLTAALQPRHRYTSAVATPEA